MADWSQTINLWPEASRWVQSTRTSCVMKSLANSRMVYVQPRKQIFLECLYMKNIDRVTAFRKACNHSIWPRLKGTCDEVVCSVLLFVGMTDFSFCFTAYFYKQRLTFKCDVTLWKNNIRGSTSRSHSVIFNIKRKTFVMRYEFTACSGYKIRIQLFLENLKM